MARQLILCLLLAGCTSPAFHLRGTPVYVEVTIPGDAQRQMLEAALVLETLLRWNGRDPTRTTTGLTQIRIVGELLKCSWCASGLAVGMYFESWGSTHDMPPRSIMFYWPQMQPVHKTAWAHELVHHWRTLSGLDADANHESADWRFASCTREAMSGIYQDEFALRCGPTK